MAFEEAQAKAGLAFGGKEQLTCGVVLCLLGMFFFLLAQPVSAMRRSYNPSRSNNIFGVSSSHFSRGSMYGGVFPLNRNYFGPLWQKPDLVPAGGSSPGAVRDKQSARTYFMSREELAPVFKEMRTARLPPPIPWRPENSGYGYERVSRKAPPHFEPRP